MSRIKAKSLCVKSWHEQQNLAPVIKYRPMVKGCGAGEIYSLSGVTCTDPDFLTVSTPVVGFVATRTACT